MYANSAAYSALVAGFDKNEVLVLFERDNYAKITVSSVILN